MSAPAGWYPDPLGRHDHRYWDGERWTDHASRGGETVTDPVDGPGPVTQGGPHGTVRWEQAAGDEGRAATGTEGLAIVSVILSVVWFFGLGSIAGIITGVIARRRIKASGGARTGDGIALAGIIIGIVTLALTILLVLVLGFFAISEVTVVSTAITIR